MLQMFTSHGLRVTPSRLTSKRAVQPRRRTSWAMMGPMRMLLQVLSCTLSLPRCYTLQGKESNGLPLSSK